MLRGVSIPAAISQTFGTLSQDSSMRSLTTNYAPTAGSSNTLFTFNANMNFVGTADPTGGAHIGAGLFWTTINAPGRTLPLTYSLEGRVDVTAGTVTAGSAVLAMLGSNTGSIGLMILNNNFVNSNAGPITQLIGNQFGINANTNTIGTVVGYQFSDLSGISGITSKFSFRNFDPNAPMTSIAIVVDQSRQVVSPSSGATVQWADNTYHLLIFNGGTTGALTIAMPVGAIPRQPCLLKTVGAITALSLSAGSGRSFLATDIITTLAAGGYIKYLFDEGSGTYYRVG